MASRSESDFVGVEEAARLLGVSARHVSRLGDQGAIHFLGRGVVERASVTEYLSERKFSRERAWSTETAWAAVALLSGLRVDWIGQTQLSRLRSRLRHMAMDDDGSHELIGRARNRADVRTYESYDFLAPTVKKNLIVSDRRRLDLATSHKDELDGYIDVTTADRLEKRLGLRRDSRGSLVLRVTTFDTNVIKRIATEGNGALAALDIAASQDARAHGVGSRALHDYLEEFARDRRALK